MRRNERARAMRISEYVDSLLVQRRSRQEHASPEPDDREVRNLMKLAGALSRIEMVPRPAFGDRLLSDLQRDPQPNSGREEAAEPRSMVDAVRRAARRLWRVPPAMRAATVMAALISLIAAFGSEMWRSHTVSAAEILTRADSALADMVRPGYVLYRRWRVVDRTQRTLGAPEMIQEKFVEEWLDGKDLRHVAGRSFTPSGGLLFAYTNIVDKDEYRPRVYFARGPSEPHGLLSIEPTRREFLEAASRFPAADRDRLAEYLARGYIYEPITGERRFNRAVIEHNDGEATVLPRTRLFMDASGFLDDVPVYKVRVIDPIRVRFLWQRDAPPLVWLARQETVRYVSRDTYLSLRTEDVVQHETGELVTTTRELIATRVAPAADEPLAFDLQVPDATPVKAQSAVAHLSAVAKALNRVPLHVITEKKEQ